MPSNIHNPRSANLAREPAGDTAPNTTEAIEAALGAAHLSMPLGQRVSAIADELAKNGEPGGCDLTPDERDEMWGP